MEILVGVIAFMVCVNVFALVYRSARSRRESVVLGFTMRIGLPLNDEVLDAVDRRIWHGLIGLSIGGLVALAGLALLLIWPQFIPTGGAGFAVGSILWAAMAIGAALLGLRLLAVPQPVSGELELQWDDALRGYALRQLWIASIALSSAAIAVSYNWMVDATSMASYFGVVITLIPMLLFALRPSKRSQSRLWSPVSTGIPG